MFREKKYKEGWLNPFDLPHRSTIEEKEERVRPQAISSPTGGRVFASEVRARRSRSVASFSNIHIR